MKQINLKPLLISAFLAIAILIACKKTNTEDPNSPAVLIKKNNTIAIPPKIAVPPTDSFIFALVAKGYQKFQAVRGLGLFPYWQTYSTSAQLFDKNNQSVGSMISDSDWYYIPNNGSNNAASMVGSIQADTLSPTGFNDIDWLLFSKKVPGREDPKSPFLKVTHVQRVLTSGGRPLRQPTVTDIGKQDSAAFTAVFKFFVRKS